MKFAEMRMLIRMFCVTQLNRIRNEYVRGSLGETNIIGKMRQNRLRCFGQMERRNNKDIVNKISH